MKKSYKKILFLLMIAIPLMASRLGAEGLSQMISPISNPVNFEDPRINTEVRPIFMHHEIGSDFVTGGGDVQLYALQLRFALTDQLALIATKDGFIDFNPDAVLSDETGFANLGLGLKYAFHQTDDSIISAGLRYEAATGNTDVFQGRGDGFVNPFVSAAKSYGNFNVMLGSGLRLGIDNDDSSFFDFDLHFDYKVGNFYPTLEFNLVQVIDAGNRIAIADEGQDLFSFGATNSRGKTIVTGAAGARYRFSKSLDGGIAYQIPLTDGAGSNITDWRVTADLIYSFNI